MALMLAVSATRFGDDGPVDTTPYVRSPAAESEQGSQGDPNQKVWTISVV